MLSASMLSHHSMQIFYVVGDTGNQSGSSKENLLTDCTTIGLPGE